MLASQKENIWREKGKNNVVPLLKDKMLFNSKCQHQKTKKLIKKKKPTLSIYLSSYLPENLEKMQTIKNITFISAPTPQNFFALQIITSEAVW